MKKELSILAIYNDFISKVMLTDLEKDILIKYIRDDSIIKISSDLAISTSTVSRTISDIKNKYSKYKKLELEKLRILEDIK